MRESLKNLFSNKIILENGTQFYYTIKPFELTNALGNAVAVLQQYQFSPADSSTTTADYKLYKTKEGNWYDVEHKDALMDKTIVRMLKSAIDKKEAAEITEL